MEEHREESGLISLFCGKLSLDGEQGGGGTDTGHPGEVMEAGQRAGWTRWVEMDQFKV